MRQSRTRGQTLLETVIAVGIAVAALAGLLAYGLERAPGAAAASTAALPALIESARTLAAGSGQGATVSFEQEPPGGAARAAFQVRIYPSRPTPGSKFDPKRPARTERFQGAFQASTGPGAVSVFIATAGTVSYATWLPGQPNLQTEPQCTQPLTLTIAPDPTLLTTPPPTPSPHHENGLTWLTLTCQNATLTPE
jgi:hypothetical protein